MGIPRVVILVTFSILGLTGCNTAKSVSLSSKSSFTNYCYKVQQDSFIYSINKCTVNNLACFGIQSFGTQKNREDRFRKIANSRTEFESNASYWNERFNSIQKVRGYDGGEIVGFVSKNTQLEIYSLDYQKWGTWGAFWKIKVKAQTGEHAGKIIQISDRMFLHPPSWLKSSSYEEGPVWKEQYVRKCD